MTNLISISIKYDHRHAGQKHHDDKLSKPYYNLFNDSVLI